MRKIKEVLRLKFEAGLSHERIAAATALSKGAVAKYVRRALTAGVAWPLAPEVDDAQLEARLFPGAPARVVAYAQPDFGQSTRSSSARASRCSCCGRSITAAQPARLQVQPVLLALRALSRAAQAFDAPGAPRRREALRRLRRPHRAAHRRGHRRDTSARRSSWPCSGPRTTPTPRRHSRRAYPTGSARTSAPSTYLGAVPALLVPDYVAGNMIRVMCPPPLCGRLQRMPRATPGGSRECGNIIGYRAFNQSRSGLSSFQTAFLRPPAEVAQTGSHARKAAALARSVNSAYRLVVSRLT